MADEVATFIVGIVIGFGLGVAYVHYVLSVDASKDSEDQSNG